MTDATLSRVIELAERDADSYVITPELATICHTLQCGSHLRVGYTAVMATWRADVPAVLASTAGMGDHTALIRDIFGNPFRPVTVSPAWRTDTVLSPAKQIYDAREFGAMPILADALQDAGCDSADVLDHCRGEGRTSAGAGSSIWCSGRSSGGA
jgi:hypothetical protein